MTIKRMISSVFTALAVSSAGYACGSPATSAHDAATASQSTAPIADPSLKLTAAAALGAVQETDEGSGTASFWTTSEGVDMHVELTGFGLGAGMALTIQQASDCTEAGLAAPIWAEGRGERIPPIHSFATNGNRGQMSYSRSAKRQGAWSIGASLASDLEGHILVARDILTGDARACGPIVRGADEARVASPPADHSPSSHTRAVLSGWCFAQQFPNKGPGCPDERGITECADVHCDLGACLAACQENASCLDGQSDACALGTCNATADCMSCQQKLQQCTLGFCAEHISCAPSTTPDGPCQRTTNCCVLQGDAAGKCLDTLAPLLSSVGGDTSCSASMVDWDVLTHRHVPCTFGAPTSPLAPTDTGLTASAAARLAADSAGAACASNADCAGGECAPLAAKSGKERNGFCTGNCEASSECGAGGICATNATPGAAKRCYAKCQDTTECRDGFACVGAIRGAIIGLPGSCQPLRQVDDLADDVAGQACASDATCQGGFCGETDLLGTSYPGNYCTGRCYSDEHCGRGGVCLWPKSSADPGYCLQACSDDSDCTRTGYGCWTMGDGERVVHACYPRAAPLPDGATGKPCSTDDQCGAVQAHCATELPFGGLESNTLMPASGGYCTQHCALDVECGAGAQCINYGSQGGLCLAICSDAAPCRPGYVCFLHGRDADLNARVCVAASSTDTP